MAEPEAMAASSVTGGMAATEEVGLVPTLAHLFPAELAVPGGTEVLSAATAEPAEREALPPYLDRVPRLPAAPAVWVALVETGSWVETAEPAVMRSPLARSPKPRAVMEAMEGIPAGSVALEV